MKAPKSEVLEEEAEPIHKLKTWTKNPHPMRKILKAMNGSRTASADFAEFFAKVMVNKLNFVRGIMEACLYVASNGT